MEMEIHMYNIKHFEQNLNIISHLMHLMYYDRLEILYIYIANLLQHLTGSQKQDPRYYDN